MIYVLQHKETKAFGVVRWNMPAYDKLIIREAHETEQIYCTTQKEAAIDTVKRFEGWQVLEFIVGGGIVIS